jgi:phosphatidylserine/phosphatidylglycerophosphate/cardiolipin synthase-like enzyme
MRRHVVDALIRAQKRHVDVALVVDYKNNFEDNRSGRPAAALNALVHAGVHVKTISVYPIHHDKVIIVDGRHVQTGSFNYTYEASRHNSENVLVVWNDVGLAQAYLKHWNRNWMQGQDYRSGY